MSKAINYKNLLNTFIDESKAYSLDIKNRLNNLFLYHSMGSVEEIMFSRNFYTGTLGSSTGNLVGIPLKIIDRIDTYYTTLKQNISAETTTIQTQLNTCSPSEYEKIYIKNILYNTLEQQYGDTMSQIIIVVNSFRDLQSKVGDTIDKLNFITLNSYDGEYIDPNGGRVRAFQLTGTTVLTNLTTNYNTSNTYLNTFITNHVNTTFTKNYPGGSEYIFFSPLIYTNDATRFIFNYNTELQKVLKYRKSSLYDNLTNTDQLGITGLSMSTQLSFKPKLNNIIKPWIDYDISLMTSRFTSNLDGGYTTLEGMLNKYYSDFDVEYGINTGATAENLVRINLRNKNIGISDGTFNYKMIEQLYIS
tara:strand:+ start:535 stop:1617 length:1083 start_codon:yes stop_codon:yes gene_type:complete